MRASLIASLDTKLVAKAEQHLIAVDGKFSELITKHGPCRLAGPPGDFLWTLVSAIISQQLSEKAASTIKRRLIERLGFPPESCAAALARATPKLLRGCGMSASKARCIRRLARDTLSGVLDLRWLARKEDSIIAETLLKYKGIGPWTVEMFLVFGLRRPDVFSFRDAGLRRAIKTFYELNHPPTDKTLAQLIGKWSPFKTVASWYLWRMLD